MTVKAYILMEVAIGTIGQVKERLQQMPGVVEVDAVAGPYDAVALVEADRPEGIGDLVLERMQSIPGIRRTITCVVVSG